MPALDLPAWLDAAQRETLHALADRNDAAHGADFLGLVLSGSTGRGYATEHSDLDVCVVLTDEAAEGRSTTHSSEVDEAVDSWSEVLTLPPFGTDGWPADELLDLVSRTLDGDVAAIRETFPRVRDACRAHDLRRGHTRTSDTIDGWGDELALFEG